MLNDLTLWDGGRLFSVYHTACGVKPHVVSEATDDKGGRAATTISLAKEY
jgi:hypothetical protein